MADRSKIEWTDTTWNPVTGCTKVSPGCDNCYAETFAERWRGTDGHYFEQGFDVQLRPGKLTEPLRWRKPRRVFVNSMSDLFHKDVPTEYIARVFAVMALTPQHTYQILTKRHGRMRALIGGAIDGGQALLEAAPDEKTAQALYDAHWPLPNVHLGVSVEDQQRADLRIPALLAGAAAVRFLSCEPLLGPVDLADYTEGLGWVIVGGESGPGARPMSPDWARSLRDQCTAADVPFFFKQWGEYRPTGWKAIGRPGDPRNVLVGDPVDDLGLRWEMRRVGKKAAGRDLDGRTWDELPAASHPRPATTR